MREPNESDTAYTRRRFKEAVDDEMLDEIDDQLRTEGISSNVIRPRKSERRKQLLKQGRSTAAVATRVSGSLSAEEIVENLPWPPDENGNINPAFVAGMRYEALNVIRGIRMAQELNQMGLEQAKPIIGMAKEMRQAEAQAAKILATELGQDAVQANDEIIKAIQSLAESQPQGQPVNPLLLAFYNAAQPFLGQILERLFSSVSGGAQQPGQLSQQAAGIEMPGQLDQPVTLDTPPSCMRPGEEDEFQEV